MKKFNLFRKRKETTPKEPVFDDEHLSSWQKENVKFLKREEHQEDEHKKLEYGETTLDVENNDVFQKKKKTYIKPTDIEDEFVEEEPILKIVRKESIDDHQHKATTDKASSKEKKTPKSSMDDFEVTIDHFSDEELLSLEKELLSLKEDEKTKEKEQKKKAKKPLFSNKVKWQASILITILVISLLIVSYYASPLSRLETITVTGNNMIPTQDIIKETSFKQGANFIHQYRQKNKNIAKIKKEFPQFKTVTIERQGLRNIAIHVQEYPLSGYLIVDKIKYSPILSNGSIINKKIKTKPKSVLYANFKQGHLLSEVMKSYSHVPEHIRALIQQITLTPSDGNDELVTLYMKDGNQVKVSGTEIADKLKYYDQVTSQMKDKGIVDMEVGIYSYPYGNENKERRMTESLLQATTDSSTTETTQEIVIPDN